MGHKQPPTPLMTDNSTAEGIMNETVRQKCSKAIDMRFYWLQDRIRPGQFKLYWRPGTENYADYFSKHHPPAHHQKMRSTYLCEQVLQLLRGCVDPGLGGVTRKYRPTGIHPVMSTHMHAGIQKPTNQITVATLQQRIF